MIAINGNGLGSRGGIRDSSKHRLIAYGSGAMAAFAAKQIDRYIAGHSKDERLPVADGKTLLVIGQGIQAYPGLLQRLLGDIRRFRVVAEAIAKTPPMRQIDPDQIVARTGNTYHHGTAINLAQAKRHSEPGDPTATA